jgi:single-stranded DNA-binding protein
MSVTALVTGKLIADPVRRTGSSGKPFTLAKIVAHDGDGDALVSVMAFGTAAVQLAALGKGDTVAVNGRAKVTTWTGRDGTAKAGLSVTADVVLTAYHLKRKRGAMVGTNESVQQPQQPHADDDFGGGPDPWLNGGGR